MTTNGGFPRYLKPPTTAAVRDNLRKSERFSDSSSHISSVRWISKEVPAYLHQSEKQVASERISVVCQLGEFTRTIQNSDF